MGMFPQHRHAIIDILDNELVEHSKLCTPEKRDTRMSDNQKCDETHRPYLEYCLQEVGLFLGYHIKLERWAK